ncbi:MAG: CarD family transcriptional regulator, partial [Sphingomonadales bacterium]
MTLPFDQILSTPYSLTLSSVPEGQDALILAELARKAAPAKPIMHVARDDARLAVMADALRFFAPDVEVISIPAWDCLPYDRVSPHPDISANRMAAFALLANSKQSTARIILTTINSALQKVPPKAHVAGESLCLETGAQLDLETLSEYLSANGYHRTTTVGEAGEFAIRGGLVDLFPAGAENPLRIDFFGDEIDSIRPFDALDQRTISRIDRYVLVPAGEMTMSKDAIRRFRQGYVAEFGTVTEEDPLYAGISEGRRIQGAEHWLPLFYGEMETLFDYLSEDTPITLDHQVDEAAIARHGAILDYYETRKAAREGDLSLSTPYKPLAPHHLYLLEEDWAQLKEDWSAHHFTPFSMPEGNNVMDAGGHVARDFAPERQASNTNIYEACIEHILAEQKAGRRVMMLSYSSGARDRLAHVLSDHGLTKTQPIESWEDFHAMTKTRVGLGIVALERGFRTDDISLITEQDVLGDRLIRRARKSKKAENFISEASSLAPGDLVVHVEHGIGRYEGLQTIDVSGAPHDCVWLTYQGGDRLYVPVENIEVLSRYGGEANASILDKLGGSGWQARKARMKKRVREMANELIKIAAARALRKG